MSVVTCGEKRVSRDGTDKTGAVQHRRAFIVTVSTEQDGGVTVLAAPGLPKLGDIYQTTTEMDAGAVCVERRPKQIGPKQWEVEILYDSAQEKKDEQDKEKDKPENWYIEVGVSHNGYQKPVDEQKGTSQEGSGVLNSAGDPFDPPPTYDASYPVLTYELACSIFPIELCLTYMNSVNADIFFGGQPRTWRILDFSTPGVQEKQFNGRTIVYYPVTIKMEYRAETHDLNVLDIGPNYLSGGVKQAFLSKEGQPYLGLLDGAGAKSTTAHFLNFRPYKEQPFGALGLPQTFTPKAFH